MNSSEMPQDLQKRLAGQKQSQAKAGPVPALRVRACWGWDGLRGPVVPSWTQPAPRVATSAATRGHSKWGEIFVSFSILLFFLLLKSLLLPSPV